MYFTMKRVMIYIVLLFSFLVGCQRELCYDHQHQNTIPLTIDWSQMSVQQQSMCLMFYPVVSTGATSMAQVFFVNRSQSTVDIAQGRYQVIAMNDDVELISFRGQSSYYTIEAFMDVTTRRDFNNSSDLINNGTRATTDDEYLIGQPEFLYSQCIDLFDVTSDSRTQAPLVIKPTLLTKTIELDVKVIGIENVLQARGQLTGVSPGVLLYNSKPNDLISATSLFTASQVPDGIKVVLNTFGLLIPTDQIAQHLQLEFLLRDGSKMSYDVDITNQIPEDLRIDGGTIVIDLTNEIVIPDAPSSGGTFVPDVEEWGDEVFEPLT